MTHNTPVSPLPPRPLGQVAHAVRSRLMTARDLREHGVSPVAANECCRPGGPWQLLLPGVYVLHPGPLTSDERLRGALLYASGGYPLAATPGDVSTGPVRDARVNPQGSASLSPVSAQSVAPPVSAQPVSAQPVAPPVPAQSVPAQPVPAEPAPGRQAHGERESATGSVPAMITGLAALALHGFTSAPAPRDLDRLDVLVPRARGPRSTGCVRVVPGGDSLPPPARVAGMPVAPVPRALADAVAELTDAATVRRLLVESVRGGHCAPAAVVRELGAARLLGRPHVADGAEALLAECRALAEGRLREMVFGSWLPDPFWNVSLRLPGGPSLGGVDAYWPEQAVAVELDTRASAPGPGAGPGFDDDRTRRRETLERAGITLVRLTPVGLRESPARQAAVVRTALMTATERTRAQNVIVEPR
jgi:hypothetical protein